MPARLATSSEAPPSGDPGSAEKCGFNPVMSPYRSPCSTAMTGANPMADMVCAMVVMVCP